MANPVLVAVVLLSSTLAWLGVPASDYTANVQTLSFLLGPATVALAVPLYRNLPRIRQVLGPVLVSIAAGVVVASSSAIAIAANQASAEQVRDVRRASTTRGRAGRPARREHVAAELRPAVQPLGRLADRSAFE